MDAGWRCQGGVRLDVLGLDTPRLEEVQVEVLVDRVVDDGGKLQEDLGGEGEQHGDHVQPHGDGAVGEDEQSPGGMQVQGSVYKDV